MSRHNKKRSIVAFTATVAMLAFSFGMSGASSAQASGQGDSVDILKVPAVVQQQAKRELSEFTGTFPKGASVPSSAVELIPEIAGTTVMKNPPLFDAEQTQVLTKKERVALPQMRNQSEEQDAYVVIVDGAFFNAQALSWQCSWLGEYLTAVDSGNKSNADKAYANLEGFADLPKVRDYLPDVDLFQKDIISPISQGDTGPARQYLAVCSGNASNASVVETSSDKIADSGVGTQSADNIIGDGPGQGTVYYTKDRYHSSATIAMSYANSRGYALYNGSIMNFGNIAFYMALHTSSSNTSFTDQKAYNPTQTATGDKVFLVPGTTSWHFSPRFFRINVYFMITSFTCNGSNPCPTGQRFEGKLTY